MCDSWKLPRGRELTPVEVGVVFGKVGHLDVVRLSGGEPFLRDDLLPVAHRILDVANPLALHVTTNGSFPERIESFCQQLGTRKRLHVMVSFDGLAAEHDKNRGRSVTFERALDTVQRLNALGKDCVQVSINHTMISNQSIADHDELRRNFEHLGVDVQWVLAYEDSAMYGESRRGKRADDLIPHQGYPLNPGIDRELALTFIERELAGARTRHHGVLRLGKQYYLTGLRDRLRNAPDPHPRPKCVALRSHLRIMPDGSVPVCQFNTEVVGSLLTDSFDSVWYGATASDCRAWVDACPGCWAECEVVPNAIYSGDLWRGILPARTRC